MTSPNGPATAALDKLARDHYGSASMRAREHGLVADRWTLAHRSFSVIAAILAAIAGGSLFTGPGPGTIKVAAVLVLLAAVVSATDAALGATTTITDHKKAADRFATLASHIARFHRVELLDGSGEAAQTARYERIMEERDSANSASPLTPVWAQHLVKGRKAGRAQPRDARTGSQSKASGAGGQGGSGTATAATEESRLGATESAQVS
jgi:hypothetical protein